MIVVGGLGPAGPEYLTSSTLDAIDRADAVLLRTARHEAALAVLERRPDSVTFDQAYEDAQSFEGLYRSIVHELVRRARSSSAAVGAPTICYLVPGSPSVAERTVELLADVAASAGVAVEVQPAVSYLDLAWARLGIDPMRQGVMLVDGASFASAASAVSTPLLVGQVWSRQLLSDVKLSIEHPHPDQRAVILYHLGLPDEQLLEVAWADLDRSVEPDHLTSLYVPSLARPPAAELTALVETMLLLRERCPWDREQTHSSLERYLLEESYEAIEALDELGDDPSAAPAAAADHVLEELGDLLCQVVFHSLLAREEGLFDLSDVSSRLNEKLVSRHPHVFGDALAETAADVVAGWEQAKDRSKQRSALLEGVPRSMPALARAEKVERKLESAGLGWRHTEEADAQLSACVARVLEVPGRAADAGAPADADADAASAADDELAGELLLGLARMLAARGIDAESALRRSLERLGERVSMLESTAAEAGEQLADWVRTASVHGRQLPLC